MIKAQNVQPKYYDSHHKLVEFEVRDLVLLNTVNLRMKGVNDKVKRNLLGHSR